MAGPSRRTFLVGAASALVACEGLRASTARWLGADWPDQVVVPDASDVDADHRFLSRVTFGPWPGDREHLGTVGRSAWLEAQLHPSSIDDGACRALARRFESVHAAPAENLSTRHAQLRQEHVRHELLRASFSQRQLLESLTALWGDHFNIALSKGDVVAYKAADHQLLRTHALGRFRDLVRASALSPAMLLYLDGADNKAGPGEVPNENYARELLELHTLGVSGGYAQQDVMEAARALSGWTVGDTDDWGRGTVRFQAQHHDPGSKQILGHTLPAGQGRSDLDALLDVVITHPSTARFVASKLCRWFLGPHAPEHAIDQVARTFSRTDGDLRACVRTTLTHPALDDPRHSRLKRPYRFVVSALRGLGAVHHAKEPLLRTLERLGQPIGGHPTPDGYPWEPAPWLGTLAWRWTFARELAHGELPAQVPWERLRSSLGRDPDALFNHLIGRAPTSLERAALAQARADGGDPWRATAALTLASPAFQVIA